MNTDYIPKSADEKEEYWRSDALRAIAMPPPEPLRTLALRLKSGLAADDKKEVQAACVSMLKELSVFYQVSTPKISILSTRPLKVTEKWVHELFGDYTPDTEKIRLWMRTAVQKKPTSYGVLLSTFCHEFFHHLDMVSLDLPETYHTRGFYERVGLLYHHIQNTPVRKIIWKENKNGTYQVDWAKTMANRPRPADHIPEAQ
jgi:hypothetical protein